MTPKNPNNNSATLAILNKMQVLKGDKGEKGDDGYSPIKGVDYFSDEEIRSIINYIQGNVTNGIDGKDGKTGKDGQPPHVELITIQEKIKKNLLLVFLNLLNQLRMV